MMICKRKVMRMIATLGAVFTFTLGTAVADTPSLTVRVDWTPWGMQAGLHLAEEKGWFDEAGVNVTITDGKGSALLMQQIAAGDVDVGWAMHSTMASARCQGMPLVAVYQLGRQGDIGFLVPAGEYQSIEDLRGKRIAYAATAGQTPFLDVFLQAGGMDRSDFTLVNVDASALVSAFVSGEVEASFVGAAFFLPIASQERAAEPILMSEYGVANPGYGLVIREDTASEKADALRRFVPVVTRAWEYIYESDANMDEAVEAVLNQRPNERLDPAILRGQIEAYEDLRFTERTVDAPAGSMHPEDWRDALEAMEEVKLCESGWDESDFFTNEFLSDEEDE